MLPLTGNVAHAVRHVRTINREVRAAQAMPSEELYSYAKQLGVSVDLLKKTAELGRLPVVTFAAGGLATPADVSMVMQLGVDGVFVGSGIFKSARPEQRAKAMVQAVTHYNDPKILAKVSEDLGEAMVSRLSGVSTGYSTVLPVTLPLAHSSLLHLSLPTAGGNNL